jgi:hypothetical protein
VEVGTPFLERANGKLQERARAIIERRPDLERFFENYLAKVCAALQLGVFVTTIDQRGISALRPQ